MTTSDPPTLMVLGATGDLTSRLLLPGLGALLSREPDRQVDLVGVGREEWDDSQWQELVRRCLSEGGAESAAVEQVARRATYVHADITSREDLQTLIERTPRLEHLVFRDAARGDHRRVRAVGAAEPARRSLPRVGEAVRHRRVIRPSAQRPDA